MEARGKDGKVCDGGAIREGDVLQKRPTEWGGFVAKVGKSRVQGFDGFITNGCNLGGFICVWLLYVSINANNSAFTLV